ncbi:uncharacterized protein LOC144644197 [Oculina patagonica]
MAESSEVSAVKVFNYICGKGGVAELSNLLTPPSPLAKKSTVYEVILWFETQKALENGLVLIKNHRGEAIGLRIDLKKQMCLKYATTESCKSAKRCKFWHICKKFLEGTCKGNCGRSHDFHDEDNRDKTIELGFEKKPSGSLKGIVTGSFMQVCLMYLKNECFSDNCPYLHICPNAVRVTPCENCTLSHNFADPHNKNILVQYGFRPPRKFEVEVVRCNTLVPKQQKPFEASLKSLNKQAISGGNLPKFLPKSQTHSKELKREPVRLSGLLQEAAKTKVSTAALPTSHQPRPQCAFPFRMGGEARSEGKSALGTRLTSHQETAVPKTDSLPEKVFNFICGKGGLASLSELLRHPSPLAKKFSGPEQEYDAKIWLQVQAQAEQGRKIILLETRDGEIVGARVSFKQKLCLYYTSVSKGTCKSHNNCNFWHICKGYLEGGCQGNCGLSHNFHDEGNIKKVKKLGLEKHPTGTVRYVVASSLPQVCLMYLTNNVCQSNYCPYLHICLSTDKQDQLSHDHNMGILKQYDLTPEKTKPNIMWCNILIPGQQRSFEAGQTNLASTASPVPLMSLPTAQQHKNILGSQKQGSSKSSEKKKKRKPRQRKRKPNQQGEATGESQGSNANDIEEESSDSVSDNEDVQDKPDLYSSSKFAVDPSKHSTNPWQEDCMERENSGTSKKPSRSHRAPQQSNDGLMEYEQVSGMIKNEAAEGNLINLSDDDPVDDWQGAGASVDDYWNEPLSQVDGLFFNDPFSPSVAGSLSQDSTLSNSFDQISLEDHPEKSAVNVVFQYICNEHNGQVPYAVISQQQDLFPPDVIDIAAWFKENNNRFITIENKTGEIEAVRAYSPKARICFRYLMAKQGCKDPKCFRYHVCKHYLANGVCPFGKKCRFSHSHNLKSPHNKYITKKLRLDSLSEEQLRVLISASVPEVCLDYNMHSGGCERGFRCNGIHICKYFVMGKCKKGDGCLLGHQSSLEMPHTKLVLEKYNLTKVPLRAVFSALLIRQMPSAVKMVEQPKTGKATQMRDVPHSPHNICLEFLLGHCSKEQLCDHYHYRAPYMWQYKYSSTDHQGDTWKSFTQSESETIEQQFCDVNVVVAEMEHIMIAPPPSALINPGEGQIKVNFDDMKAETGFGYVQLRRLSTKPAISPTDHALSTQWVWYWLDESSSSWREYDSELMHQMELTFTKGRAPFFKFKVQGEEHKLFFRTVPMYQQSTKPPVSITRVRRRPVFRSTSEMQGLQRPLELPIPLEPEASQSPATSAPGRLPPQWTSVPENEEFIRVTLPTSSDQFKLAESLFRRSMSENKATIVSIERVQNPFVWEKYARKKDQMEKRARIKDSPVNEKLLFHGTDPQHVDSICAENFDWRALDEDRAALFGQGAYFREEAALSKLYCKQDSESFQYMFMAEVLVGSFAKGEPSLRKPPVKSESSPKKELYDSCVDNAEKPTIFVLFDPDQYYPSFLIKFKTKSKVVC